jgi:predicted nucleotidyltransferase
MLQLTPDEQTWLETYRQALNEQYPGMIIRMVIYGSKARGEAHSDSDVDVLLIVKNDAGQSNGSGQAISAKVSTIAWQRIRMPEPSSPLKRRSANVSGRESLSNACNGICLQKD